jgi:ribosomal protein S12 methylthiotransferase accessory factor YcaO
MSKISAIREAIETLSEEEYVQLRQWFSERDWKKWDQEIEKDSKSGKLDFLIKEAFDDKRQGKLKDL